MTGSEQEYRLQYSDDPAWERALKQIRQRHATRKVCHDSDALFPHGNIIAPTTLRPHNVPEEE